MKKILLALICTIFTLVGCSQESVAPNEETKVDVAVEESHFPVTIEHVHGETVIEKMPERIAAGDFIVLEHLFALGLSPVATGHMELAEGFSVLQPYLDENPNIEVLSANFSSPVDYEKLLAVQPDLIIAYDWVQIDYEKASKIAPTIILNSKLNYETEDSDEFSTTFEQLAKAVGVEEKYKEYMQDFNNKIDEANQVIKDKGIEGQTALFIMATEKSYDVRDHNFYFTQVNLTPVEMLHGEQLPTKHIDLETLIKADPDILFLGEDYTNRTGAVEKLLANEAFQQISAVKKNQVYKIDTAAFGPMALGKMNGVESIKNSLSGQ